ncbi:inositol monophosphatase family protein [Roseibium sediminicola]|uniref:Inositol monophosphatase n=1 Tax=Roseibium sediminicola TaxID=2933272 RepID=A0ABT0H1W2_9HYPH|nr:inositol monophosphatase [Roseibium sp. CAU 1639]MCK7615058.1 inositol monophosphatase [Roseibium sp. CAU 1639]
MISEIANLASVTRDLEARFRLATDIAVDAGAMAFDYFRRRKELTIEVKGGLQDVVSIADRTVETLIRARIAEAFPEDGILGEEHGFQTSGSGYTWVVDPIDGTSAFVHGHTNWCVSIALLFGGEPVIGVIRVPCDDETFKAMKGAGATLNGVTLKLDMSMTLQNSLTGIGANQSVPPERVGALISGLMALGGNYIRTGSGAQMLAMVAAGRLAGFFEPSMHAWDCLAGYCLVSEAGGRYRPFPVDGSAILESGPVLAAGPGAFEALSSLAEKGKGYTT